MDPNSAKEIYDLNSPLLGNLLEALLKAAIQPKRVLLHIGRGRNPILESDPAPKHLQPYQFYYAQDQQLFDYCAKHPETSWNIVRPGPIVGAVNKTWLNSMYPFAVYAAVQAHKGEALAFGGDFESWQYPFVWSSARMTGYLSEWAVLEESAANQDFNAGVELPKLDEKRNFDKTVTLTGGKDAPLSYGPPMKGPMEFTLADWARKPENQQAWNEIMAQSGIDFDPFESDEDIDHTFLVDYCYIRLGVMSNDKVRDFGFTGHVSTVDTVFEMYEEFAKMGMLPKMKTKEAKAIGVTA